MRVSSLRERLLARKLSRYVLNDIVLQDDGNHQAQWLKTSGSTFRDPFFALTAKRVLAKEQERALCTTSLDVLPHLRPGKKHLYPSGFIFHVGRCGSTLLSNMLASIDEHFILSEPNLPIAAVLRHPGRYAPSQLRDLTRAAILTLATAAPPGAERFFIKFFHCYTMSLPLIREAVPNVPEVFVYRDPVEVIVSMMASPTQPWLWNEFMTGLPLSAAGERPLAELAARAVGRLLKSMCERVADNTMLVNYSDISVSSAAALLDHFGAACDSRAMTRMLSVMSIDAKDPTRSRSFTPDSEQKQKRASALVRDCAAHYASDSYNDLERLRSKRRTVPLPR